MQTTRSLLNVSQLDGVEYAMVWKKRSANNTPAVLSADNNNNNNQNEEIPVKTTSAQDKERQPETTTENESDNSGTTPFSEKQHNQDDTNKDEWNGVERKNKKKKKSKDNKKRTPTEAANLRTAKSAKEVKANQMILNEATTKKDETYPSTVKTIVKPEEYRLTKKQVIFSKFPATTTRDGSILTKTRSTE